MSTDLSTPHNEQRLLWAGFFSIFASGVGFSVRGGILIYWANDFGFTMSDLGGITGGGLAGFGVFIIVGALFADWIGYGRMMALAFVMHVLSAILQLFAGEVHAQFGQNATYWTLYVAMFMFAIANGMCEVVVNPMVATLFPTKKTHYLNILHAGWPGGLIAGGWVSFVMNGGSLAGWTLFPHKVSWMIQMSMFLVPVLIYGAMMLGQTFPKSEASQAGTSYGEMLLQFVSPILLLLLFIHALVGYVELGTDSWISKITGSILSDPKSGLLLFVYTSGLMFALRFVAGPIEHALTPLGLLCVSGIFGAIGLTLLGRAEGAVFCVAAATVYALGKTFLWPTMLAVASERFPKGGAIVIGAMGGVGMLSAGFLGGPGIGFKQDYYASEKLKAENPSVSKEFSAAEDNSFLGMKVRGLDGGKVGKVVNKHEELEKAVADAKEAKDPQKIEAAETALKAWLASDDGKADKVIEEASLYGGRMALQLTAAVPATMAVLYLLLILYFKLQGGYKRVELAPEHSALAMGHSPVDHRYGITGEAVVTDRNQRMNTEFVERPRDALRALNEHSQKPVPAAALAGTINDIARPRGLRMSSLRLLVVRMIVSTLFPAAVAVAGASPGAAEWAAAQRCVERRYFEGRQDRREAPVIGEAQPGEVGIWDFATRKPLKRYAEDRGVCSVVLSGDGKLLAYGSWTHHVKVYDWAADKEIASFPVAGPARVAISPDDKLLATATEGKTAQLWELPQCRLLADLEGDLMRFHSVLFSPDGKQVLAAGGDWKNGGFNRVTIWDVDSKNQVGSLIGHTNAVICMIYSPDGKTIASGGVDNTIRLWDAVTFTPLKTLKGHVGWLEGLVFTSDSKTLLSASMDKTVRFWDVATGEEKAGRITMQGVVRSVLFTPDRKALLVGGGPRFLKILDAVTHAESAALWNGPAALQPALPIDVVAPQNAPMDNVPIAVPIGADAPRSGFWLLAAVILVPALTLLLLAAGAVAYFIRQRRHAGR